MATYYVTLPNSGVTAEVTANTTRQARTAYLDYMTRSNIVPWKGRQDLRDQLLIDKITPGQIPTDVELAYGQRGAVSEPQETLSVAPDYTQDPVSTGSYDDYGDTSGQYPDPNVHAPFRDEYDDFDDDFDDEFDPTYISDEVPSYRVERQEVVPSVSKLKKVGNGADKLKNRMVPSISKNSDPLANIPTSPTGNKKLPLPSAKGLKMGPAGSGLNVNGDTKIARLVKDQYPKGKM